MGVIGWEGKWNHKEPCPMCLARRYVNCPSCGGLYHRPFFVHSRSRAAVRTAFPPLVWGRAWRQKMICDA